MLSIDKKLADKIGDNFIIAREDDKPIYAITSNYLKCKPCIMPDRPDKLLRREDWLQFIRKYRLSNSDVRKLRSTWTLGAPSFESNNPRAMFAFKEIEEMLLKRMRSNYAPNKGNIFPWFAMSTDNHSPDNIALFGNTSCGKTRFLDKMLTTVNRQGENWATGRPIVCFLAHPEDPSLAASRKLHKKRWLDIDISRIQSDISLEMVDPGALVIFDDVLELPRGDARKRVLYNLLNALVTRGRHRKGKKGNAKRGNEVAVISHLGSARELQNVRNACKWWCLFPNCSRTQSVHILRARLHYTKRQTEELLDRCGNSRFALIRHHVPTMVISSNHIELLN